MSFQVHPQFPSVIRRRNQLLQPSQPTDIFPPRTVALYDSVNIHTAGSEPPRMSPRTGVYMNRDQAGLRSTVWIPRVIVLRLALVSEMSVPLIRISYSKHRIFRSYEGGKLTLL